MFCPYAIGQALVQQISYEYNEDGTVKGQELVEHATPKFAKCKEHECGAWREGRCFFNGK